MVFPLSDIRILSRWIRRTRCSCHRDSSRRVSWTDNKDTPRDHDSIHGLSTLSWPD
jgi:hypothetical protein